MKRKEIRFHLWYPELRWPGLQIWRYLLMRCGHECGWRRYQITDDQKNADQATDNPRLPANLRFWRLSARRKGYAGVRWSGW